MFQTSDYLEDKIISYKNIINIISYDSSLQDVLAMGDRYTRESENNWSIPGGNTGNIMYTMNSSKDISTIRLYSLSGKNSFENSPSYQALTREEQQTWLRLYSNIDEKHYLWIAPSTLSSSKELGHTMLFKKIPSVSKLFSYVGVISATLEDTVFHDVLVQAATTPNTSVLLFNSNYETIDSYGNAFPFYPEQLRELESEYNMSSEMPIQFIEYQGESYLIGYQRLANSDWALLLLIPQKDALSSNIIYLQQSILFFLLIILLSLPFVFLASRFITTRIDRLNQHIDKAKSSNYKMIPLYNGNDEVGQLTSNFNEMIEKINELLTSQYQSGYALKDLELQVLQSQINPHFLYNTLDMIFWLSCDYEDQRVSKIAKELGSFYKLSLGYGENIVSIKDELAHVMAYTAIQNIRFDNRIKLSIKVPEELFHYSIVKLILQPLVENAILHGIREKMSESGEIIIGGERNESCIRLFIEDNGVGMSDEEINILLSPPSENTGYAIWNIEERIKLTYGPGYGLHFNSIAGVGTTVTVLLPVTPLMNEKNPR
ncbi:MAG: sensor histidine kinase [Lachnospiraceae bacterium]